MYLQEINKSLEEFTRQWNYYGLSTEAGSSPVQFWIEGILRTANDRKSSLDDILTENYFGIE